MDLRRPALPRQQVGLGAGGEHPSRQTPRHHPRSRDDGVGQLADFAGVILGQHEDRSAGAPRRGGRGARVFVQPPRGQRAQGPRRGVLSVGGVSRAPGNAPLPLEHRGDVGGQSLVLSGEKRRAPHREGRQLGARVPQPDPGAPLHQPPSDDGDARGVHFSRRRFCPRRVPRLHRQPERDGQLPRGSRRVSRPPRFRQGARGIPADRLQLHGAYGGARSALPRRRHPNRGGAHPNQEGGEDPPLFSGLG